jgi:hypothetical protein
VRNLLIAASLLPALANAQGSTLCEFSSDNAVFDDGVSMGGPNLLLAIKLTATANLAVTRLEVFTGEATGTNTLGLWNHDPVTNMPLANLGTGAWSMSRANGWQGATLPPLAIASGQIFWLVWGPINGAQATVEMRGSPVAPGAQFYRGSFDAGQTWTGGANGFLSHLWKYRILCGGAPGSYESFGASCAGSGRRTPSLGFSGVPSINQPMAVTVTSALPSTAALLSIGSSDTQWLGLGLPFDLTPYGATNCRIWCNVLDFLVAQTDAQGNGGVTVQVPPDRSLLGARLFNQWWVLDPTANPLMLVFTNGGKGVIGD